MIVDNISVIRPLLKFKEGVFYFIQVIQRQKDNPDLYKSDVKRYQCFVTSLQDFDFHLDRIKKECSDWNARAYISLVPRSLEKLSKLCLLEYAKRVSKGEYKRAWDIPNRLALSDEVRMSGIYSKPWRLFDVDDTKDTDKIKESCREVGIEIAAEIQTKTGVHLLVEAYNPKDLEKKFTRDGEDYYSSAGRFTLRLDCNTILYACFR